jgi:alcohol dehydrogenase (cytochrome c)
MIDAMRYLPCVLLAAATCALAQTAPAQTSDFGATHADWPSYGGTVYSWRYSALDQVNTNNVKQLAPAWIFQTGDYGENLQATPIVIDGVMYIITPHLNVFALNAATGSLIWHYSYGAPQPGRPGGMNFVQNRGVAVGAGKVFFGTTDHNLVALDAKTGKEEWRVAVDDNKQCGCDITAAPLVAGDKVIVGETGGDAAHRGYLTAFSTKTGRLAWRWYVIPGPGEKGHETWKGDSWKLGGGAPWMTGSYDPELNLVYWGTGNAGGDFNDEARLPEGQKGKTNLNLYTASVVALDVNTGKLRWYHQEVPDDLWDFDSAYECILIDRPINGRMRKLLVHMNKSGLTSVMDRETGEFIGAFVPTEVTTWISGVTEDGKLVGRREPQAGKVVDVCPSAAGAKSWNSMAYSPRTGFVYMPINEVCNDLTSSSTEAQEGRFHANGGFSMKLPPNRTTYSHIDAWDPVTRKKIWSVPYKYILLASMLATGGDLVFTGTPEGDFLALNARTGQKLWTYQTGAGIRSSPISYSVGGRQYIAVPTGWQKSITGTQLALFPGQDWRLGSTMIVFALPEGSK